MTLTPACKRLHFPASCNAETFDTGDVTFIDIESRKSTYLITHFPVALRLSWVTFPVLCLVIVVSRFSCSPEIQLQRADTEFNKRVMLLIPPPKQRSDIVEGMAEEIFRYAAYPLCSE